MVAALANVVTNYIFIKKFGYLAAGFTTLFCNFLMAICHYIYARWIMKKKNMDYFDVREVAFLSIITISSAIIMCFLYKYIILRYALAVLLITILIVKKDDIIKMVKDFRNKGKVKEAA